MASVTSPHSPHTHTHTHTHNTHSRPHTFVRLCALRPVRHIGGSWGWRWAHEPGGRERAERCAHPSGEGLRRLSRLSEQKSRPVTAIPLSAPLWSPAWAPWLYDGAAAAHLAPARQPTILLRALRCPLIAGTLSCSIGRRALPVRVGLDPHPRLSRVGRDSPLRTYSLPLD